MVQDDYVLVTSFWSGITENQALKISMRHIVVPIHGSRHSPAPNMVAFFTVAYEDGP